MKACSVRIRYLKFDEISEKKVKDGNIKRGMKK